MTLNLTVLTDTYAVQSADFRLSVSENSRLRVVDDTSCKIVQLSYLEWHGLLTYTGLGRLHGKDVSELVEDWLSYLGELSFSEVVSRVQAKGTEMLRNAPRNDGRIHPHTFVVVGLLPRPVVAVISNFEGLGSPRTDVQPELRLETGDVGGRPARVLVTGSPQLVVSRPQRRALELLAADPNQSITRVQAAMREMNRMYAEANPGGPVSIDCFSASINVEGQGQTSGGPAGMSPRIVSGFGRPANFHQIIRDVVGPNARLIGSATARASSRAPAAEPPVSCLSRSEMSSTESYSVAELETQGGSATTLGISSRGAVVGRHAPRMGTPEQPCLWNEAGELSLLPTLGGISGSAAAVTDDGTAFGSVEDPTRSMRPAMWPDHSSIRVLLGPGGSIRGQVHRATENGELIGWVSIEDRGEQRFWRPALWRTDYSVEILEDPSFDWGYATSALSDEVVLLTGYRGRAAIPFLWTGNRVQALTDGTFSVIGVGITEEGEVLGRINNRQGESVAVTWTQPRGWSPVDLAPGWVPSAVSPGGTIVGSVTVGQFSRPWVKHRGEPPQLLPHFAYHNHGANGINRAGAIVGSAHDDRKSHPLIWSPRAGATR